MLNVFTIKEAIWKIKGTRYSLKKLGKQQNINQNKLMLCHLTTATWMSSGEIRRTARLIPHQIIDL